MVGEADCYIGECREMVGTRVRADANDDRRFENKEARALKCIGGYKLCVRGEEGELRGASPRRITVH